MLNMDCGLSGARNPLLHVNIFIDEHERDRGILELLRRLRPHWKAPDIQMKASELTLVQYGLSETLYLFKKLHVFQSFVV